MGSNGENGIGRGEWDQMKRIESDGGGNAGQE